MGSASSVVANGLNSFRMNGEHVPGDYPDLTDLYPYSYHDEESESEKEADAFVAYLNSIARALLVGCGYGSYSDYESTDKKNSEKKKRRRRALPPELVYYIFELARIPSPYPEWVYCFPPSANDDKKEWDQSMSANSRRLRRERKGMQEHNLDVPLSRLDLWSSIVPTHSTHPLHTTSTYSSSSNYNINNNSNNYRAPSTPQSTYVLRSTFGSTARKSFFLTPSFSKSEIERIARIQVCTVSKDQGWVSNSRTGSWSWWEVGVVSVGDKEGENLETSPTHTQTEISTPAKAHISHFNRLASRSFQPCVGRAFNFTSPTSESLNSLSNSPIHNNSTNPDTDPHSPYSIKDEDAQLYTSLRDAGSGARLAIIGCARFPGWMCVASEGRVVVWSVFRPDLE